MRIDNSMKENLKPMGRTTRLYKSNYSKIDWGNGNCEKRVLDKIRNLHFTELVECLNPNNNDYRLDPVEMKCPRCDRVEIARLSVKRKDMDIHKDRTTNIYGCIECGAMIDPVTGGAIEIDPNGRVLTAELIFQYLEKRRKQ